MAMSERAKAARAAYMREYRKKNRARILENDRKRKEKYWERKADEMEQLETVESEGAQDD